jgi:DNA-binding Xre family transcriptional regulator
MTKLGEYLERRAVNKSHVSRRTGISKQRISEISTKDSARLQADEVYLIALAIEVNPCELLEYVCSDVKLVAK